LNAVDFVCITLLITCWIKCSPASGYFFVGPRLHGTWQHCDNDMQVIAHDGVAINSAGENFAEVFEPCFDPVLSMCEALLQILIKSAQPSSAHTALNAVIKTSSCGINDLCARLSHGRKIAA
jgi:hypothetical protein